MPKRRQTYDYTLTEHDHAAINALKQRFASFHDPRIPGKITYPLEEVLIIALCATLADCNHFTEMEFFADANQDWLRTFLPLKSGTPSHDIFRNVLTLIKPQALLEIMKEWAGELPDTHIIIDGKALRGTNQNPTSRASVFILRAYSRQAGISIGQALCEDKSNELGTLPTLLETLDLKGTLVSIDAMAGHPHIAEQLHAQGADWLLALKRNEKQTYEEIDHYFQTHYPQAPETPDEPLPPCHAGHTRYETLEQSHGRHEQRIYISVAPKTFYTRDWKWPGIQSITMVHRTTYRKGPRSALSQEVHYYLSTLPASTPEKLAESIRGHWQVENTCHHILDITYREDHCQVQDKQAAQNLSLLREMATKLHKLHPLEASIASKRKRAAFFPAFLSQVIAGISGLFRA